MRARFLNFTILVALLVTLKSSAFEGRINATLTLGGETQTLHYTVGTNQLRIERAETNRPYARNLFTIDSGALMLLFPHNRSFVRLKDTNEGGAGSPLPAVGALGDSRPTTMPQMPMPPGGLPPGVGAQPQTPTAPAVSAHIGPTNLPSLPQMPQMPAGMGVGISGGMPAMPMMPPMPMMEKVELKRTGEKTNLLGFACEKFELKQRGEVMEIWATDKLLPFQPYQQNQPHRFGPRMIEEQWGDMLKAKKLFPLLAIVRFENAAPSAGGGPPAAGPERYRFEVKAITPGKIVDDDGNLFQPPPGYQEIQPLPF